MSGFDDALGGQPAPAGGNPTTPPATPPATTTPPAATTPAPAPTPGAPPAPTPPAVAEQPATTTILQFDLNGQPQHVQELMKAKGFDKNPSALAMSYFEANRALSGSKDVVAIPADDADKATMDAFYAKLGRPDTPDAYQWTVPAGVETDAEFDKFAKGFFHQAGVPANKVQGLVDQWNTWAQSRVAAEATGLAQQDAAKVDAFKAKLTAENVNPAQVLGRANEILNGVGVSPETKAWFEQNAGVAPVVELMARLGQKIGGEAKFLEPGSQAPSDSVAHLSREQAQSEITRLQSDVEHSKAYTDANHPNHKNAVAKMEQLFARLSRP